MPRRPGGGLHGARGLGDAASPAARSTGSSPGVFARVGPNETRKLVTGEAGRAGAGARRRPRAGVRGDASSPMRASRTRSMADVTVKRVEEFEAIFGGGFRRVRAGLGVSSFGIAVMELPPQLHRLPRPRPGPRPPGGGLHGAHAAGRRCMSAARRARARARRLGPGRARRAAQDHHRRRARAGAGGRRLAGRAPTSRRSSPRRARPTRSGSSTRTEQRPRPLAR